MKIALAQVLFRLGDFENNYKKLLTNVEKAKSQQADLLLFPEGGLWSYPPKDFLYHKKYFETQQQKLQQLKKQIPKKLTLLLPGFHCQNQKTQNGVFLIEREKKIRFFAKQFLPNQEVFFESRYFESGKASENFFFWKKKRIQLLVCEDLWKVQALKKADWIFVFNASPYTLNKPHSRLKRMKEINKSAKEGSVYLNLVGAQDSLIFDGASFALNSKSETVWQAPAFQEDFGLLDRGLNKATEKKQILAKALSLQAQKEQALILGIREFFYQSGFSKAVLGLSGGIDSALTAYLACQALGSKNVHAFFLPGPYTQKASFRIVKALAKTLEISVTEKNISPWFRFGLKEAFDNKKLKSLSQQNLQSRLRMLFLMLKANELPALLLATGNKSELATGYGTLYGDLAGALSPIGDLLKGEVYDLAQFIQDKKPVFPKELFSREPSAELAKGQKDSDDLPLYKDLDPILKKIFEGQALKTQAEIKIQKRVQSQEFKRKQAPPLLKLTERDLGESWRYPLAHRFDWI